MCTQLCVCWRQTEALYVCVCMEHITMAVLSRIIMNFEQTPELYLISGLQISDWLPVLNSTVYLYCNHRQL